MVVAALLVLWPAFVVARDALAALPVALGSPLVAGCAKRAESTCVGCWPLAPAAACPAVCVCAGVVVRVIG